MDERDRKARPYGNQRPFGNCARQAPLPMQVRELLPCTTALRTEGPIPSHANRMFHLASPTGLSASPRIGESELAPSAA